MLSSYKQDIYWPDSGGIDGAPRDISFEPGASLKPVVSIMDLGKMLLHCARLGETTQVRDLMSRGAPFTTDWLGTSALHVAASQNHRDTCDVLIKAGISKNARTKVDRTPLHFAAYAGHSDVVQLLLDYECEVDAKDMLRMTPLHWAVEKRFGRIVELLLRHGADPSCQSKFDRTPLSIALATEQHDVYQLLLDAKQKIGDPEQQRATDGLMFELGRSRDVEAAGSRSPAAADAPYSPASDEQSPPYAQLDASDQERLSANGLAIDESLSKLQQGAETSAGVDTSTLQILKDHGISMLEDTDGTLLNSALQGGRRLVLSDAGKLILNDPKFRNVVTSVTAPATAAHAAIQAKLKRPLTTFVPGNAASAAIASQLGNVRIEQIRKRPTIVVPAKLATGAPTANGPPSPGKAPAVAGTVPLKPNKVIKILSAEEFKQMCGANATAGGSLKKLASDSFGKVPLKYQTISNTNILTQLTRKKPILNKIKLGTLTGTATSVAKGSMLNEIKITGIKPVGSPPQFPKPVTIASTSTGTVPTVASFQLSAATPAASAGAMHLDPDTEYISRLSQNQAKAAAAAAAIATGSTSHAPNVRLSPAVGFQRVSIAGSALRHPLSQSEIERQLLELRKETDELRKQFDLSQKQNEEYRKRLEKLERSEEERSERRDDGS